MAEAAGVASGAASGATAGAAFGPWGAAIGGIIGGGMALFSDGGEDDAARAQEKAQQRMEGRQQIAIWDVESATDDYISRLDEIDANFDPYDMEQAYASFYEGVILPMERDFKEYVIPGIHAAYSGGIFGPESYQSGAAKEAELKAQRELTLKEGELRAGERDKAIGRNFQLNAMEKEGAKDRLTASTLAPNLQFGAASDAFAAESTSIEARFAADTAKRDALLGLPSSIISGATAGGSIQEGINRVFGKKTNPLTEEMGPVPVTGV